MFLEDIYDEELGVAPKKPKKKKKKIGKKIGKAFKAVATGGASLAVSAAKKSKLGRKVLKTAGAIATGGISAAVKAGKKKLAKVLHSKSAKKPVVKSVVAKLAAAGMPQAKPVAKAIVNRVKNKKAGECKCKSDLVKLVAGKLVAELAPPLNQANQMLAKADLQRRVTYEHRKLMRDDDFRRRVLAFISRKARGGNRSCQRTISFLRS